MKEIWSVPRNFCSKPERCGNMPDLIQKSRMATNVCYFESKEEAWKYYNAGKEREQNEAIARDMMIELAGKGKFVLKFALISEKGEPLVSSSYEFEALNNSDAIKKTEEFIKQKNSYKDGNKCVQEKLYRLLPVEEME